MAQNYTYVTGTYNGCDLHIIRTEAWNIVMGGLRQEKTLASGYFYGINGAFFDPNGPDGNTKSIALNNNTPIYYKTQNGKDTGGWHNKMGHACLCYDNANKKLVFRSKAAPSSSGLNKDMSSGDSLDNVVAASARYWAQGGPDFRLGMPDGSWEEGLQSEVGKEPVNDTYKSTRACICANLSANMVYLIISTSKATIPAFRKAVHSYLYVPTSGYHTNVVGIFLDGGGSTSMRCKDNNGNVFSFGDRLLEQIIALRDVN